MGCPEAGLCWRAGSPKVKEKQISTMTHSAVDSGLSVPLSETFQSYRHISRSGAHPWPSTGTPFVGLAWKTGPPQQHLGSLRSLMQAVGLVGCAQPQQLQMSLHLSIELQTPVRVRVMSKPFLSGADGRGAMYKSMGMHVHACKHVSECVRICVHM